MNVLAFKSVLTFILVVSIVAGAMVGLAIGSMIGALGGGSVFGFGGLLLGGGLGYVFGVYAHGVAYTLLSINDHLAAIRGVGAEPGAAPQASSSTVTFSPRSGKVKVD